MVNSCKPLKKFVYLSQTGRKPVPLRRITPLGVICPVLIDIPPRHGLETAHSGWLRRRIFGLSSTAFQNIGIDHEGP
jgi:hypothetical protein